MRLSTSYTNKIWVIILSRVINHTPALVRLLAKGRVLTVCGICRHFTKNGPLSTPSCGMRFNKTHLMHIKSVLAPCDCWNKRFPDRYSYGTPRVARSDWKNATDFPYCVQRSNLVERMGVVGVQFSIHLELSIHLHIALLHHCPKLGH